MSLKRSTSSFEAQWHGECWSCEDHITPGDLIKYVDDGQARRIVHDKCRDEKPTKFQGTSLEDMGF